MIIENLKQIVNKNKEVNPLYLRNLLKEYLQFYTLNFIYGSKWGENFLFKGGSCLRMFLDLPRLSEDLDLDILDENAFDLESFLTDLKNYFLKTLQFKDLEIKVSGQENIIKLKFPILDKLGLADSKSQTKILFLRIDLARAVGKKYKTEISLKSTYSFSFLVKRYSLPDLFCGKIAAILQRTNKGKIPEARIKGRDYFDLAWFLEKGVIPNFSYLEEIVREKDKKAVVLKLKEKVKNLDLTLLREDLLPLFPDKNFVLNFVVNYKKLVLSELTEKFKGS